VFNRSPRRRRAPRTCLSIQQLEPRHALAALLDLHGNLTVNGTAGDDHIHLDASTTAGSLSVILNRAPDPIRQQVLRPDGSIGIRRVGSVAADSIRSIRINGLDGHDRLVAIAAPIRVTLDGGGGNDFLVGSPFNDVIFTGDGDFNTARGEDGHDTIYGGRGVDTLDGGRGNDILAGGFGADWLVGGDDHDTLHGGDGGDTLSGGAGNDKLYGGNHDDTLFGDDGDDMLSGGNARDTLSGGNGADTLLGGNHDDTLSGGDGDDILAGQRGNDVLHGEGGHDQLGMVLTPAGWADEPGNDRLYGGSGNDALRGGTGNDGLFGGTGLNQVVDWQGADRVLTLTRAGARDEVFFRGPEDAAVPFHDTAGDATYRAGFWSEADVIRVDTALHNLHQHVGNTRLLKLADGNDLPGFYATGVAYVDTGIGGWNGGGAITLVNPPVHHDLSLFNLVYHEIAHNWDEATENDRIAGFQALSGWVNRTTSPGSDFARHRDEGTWWFRTAASFADEYGKVNPFEDYATSFEKYFMERYHVGAGGWTDARVPEKFANLGRLFADLRA
jgi:Ca2+-binding RTX toxin-like protein